MVKSLWSVGTEIFLLYYEIEANECYSLFQDSWKPLCPTSYDKWSNTPVITYNPSLNRVHVFCVEHDVEWDIQKKNEEYSVYSENFRYLLQISSMNNSIQYRQWSVLYILFSTGPSKLCRIMEPFPSSIRIVLNTSEGPTVFLCVLSIDNNLFVKYVYY